MIETWGPSNIVCCGGGKSTKERKLDSCAPDMCVSAAARRALLRFTQSTTFYGEWLNSNISSLYLLDLMYQNGSATNQFQMLPKKSYWGTYTFSPFTDYIRNMSTLPWRPSEKERRKLISHSLGKSKQKRNKRWWCWWQYTNQSSVQKIRPAAINGLSHRERQPRHTTPYNGSIGRFQLPVFATIFLKSLKQPRCLEVIEAIKTEAVWVLFFLQVRLIHDLISPMGNSAHSMLRAWCFSLTTWHWRVHQLSIFLIPITLIWGKPWRG